MSRILMISDIHGCLSQFNELLGSIKYIPSEDELILLGDYVDRGPQSKETIEGVRELVNNYGVIALRGNHDQRLIDLIRTDKEEVQTKFLEHGGLHTLRKSTIIAILIFLNPCLFIMKMYIISMFMRV